MSNPSRGVTYEIGRGVFVAFAPRNLRPNHLYLPVKACVDIALGEGYY